MGGRQIVSLNYLFTVASSNQETHLLDLTFPLGVAYVAAAMRAAGFSVFGFNPYFGGRSDFAKSILEYHAEGYNVFGFNPLLAKKEDLLKSLFENKIDVLCIGSNSFRYNETESIISLAKQANSNLVVVLGGAIVTPDPIVVMKNIGADFAAVGQGEITMVELANALEIAKAGGQPDYGAIDGLVYKSSDGALVVNRPRRDIEDLDSLPFPAYDLFSFDEFIEITSTLSITASRSCPYNCTFCSKTSGTKYVQRSLDNVFDEIKHWLNKSNGKVERLYIYDELFSLDKPRVLDFCKRIKEFGLKFSVQTRADTTDEEIIISLKESGCCSLALGIESADDGILNSMKKGITFAQISNALELAHKTGLPTIGNFIFGDLEETLETANKTINWWKEHPELGIDIALLMIVLYPGSHLYKYAVQRGIISDELKFLQEGCPNLNVSKLSNQQYELIQAEITRINLAVRFPPANNVQIRKISTNGKEIFLHVACPNCCTKLYIYTNSIKTQVYCCQTCNRYMSVRTESIVDYDVFTHFLQVCLDNIFQHYAHNNNKIIVYGLGKLALGLTMFSEKLRECIVGFTGFDHSDYRDGFLGYKTFDPRELKNNSSDYILIASTRYSEIKHTIENELQLSIPIIDISHIFSGA
jgi:radical SAM superfamily enzyme YgiQ (UPF0313 family)